MSLSYDVSLQTATDSSDQHVWRLEIVASSTSAGLPSEIFKYHVLTPGSDVDEICEAVCGLADLSEYGTSPILTGSEIRPFYRKDRLVLDFKSPSERKQVLQAIQEDILDLWNNFIADKDDEVYTVVLT